MKGLALLGVIVGMAVVPTAQAQVFDGLRLAPSLPGFEMINPTAGLLSGLRGGIGGVVLTGPAAIADSLIRARCVALVNYVSGGSNGSVTQTFEAQRVNLTC